MHFWISCLSSLPLKLHKFSAVYLVQLRTATKMINLTKEKIENYAKKKNANWKDLLYDFY